jgi:hypothetical protein
MLTLKRTKSNKAAIVLTLAVFVAFAIFVVVMLGNAAAKSEEEEIRAVEDSIRRAVLSCYAFEGFYPNSIEYLVENYNLVIDDERFVIFYEQIADNLMPVIVVHAIGGGG